MRKSNSLHQIMRAIKQSLYNTPYSCLLDFFFDLLFWYNVFTEIRQDSLHFDSLMNPSHYESISVTWAVYFFKVDDRNTKNRC